MADLLFDERIYRTLTIKHANKDDGTVFIVPGVTQMTYAGSFYESPAAAYQSGIDKIEELTDPNSDTNKEPFNSIRQSADDRAKAIINANKNNAQFYNAPL